MDKLIICRCEEVSLEDIENTASKYSCSARELKLRTRAGMGYCGGRTCRLPSMQSSKQLQAKNRVMISH